MEVERLLLRGFAEDQRVELVAPGPCFRVDDLELLVELLTPLLRDEQLLGRVVLASGKLLTLVNDPDHLDDDRSRGQVCDGVVAFTLGHRATLAELLLDGADDHVTLVAKMVMRHRRTGRVLQRRLVGRRKPARELARRRVVRIDIDEDGLLEGLHLALEPRIAAGHEHEREHCENRRYRNKTLNSIHLNLQEHRLKV